VRKTRSQRLTVLPATNLGKTSGTGKIPATRIITSTLASPASQNSKSTALRRLPAQCNPGVPVCRLTEKDSSCHRLTSFAKQT
jgi:hypothetical protein